MISQEAIDKYKERALKCATCTELDGHYTKCGNTPIGVNEVITILTELESTRTDYAKVKKDYENCCTKFVNLGINELTSSQGLD